MTCGSTEGYRIEDEVHELDPRNRCDILKDSVHGYIRFTHLPKSEATEKDLIDSPWVQRLRRIRQLQTAWYVYPSADHTRFIHSLAVMELAGRFARMVYEPYWHSQEAKRRGGRLPSPALVVETLRIAGLLHDVGHGPLSHLLDRYVLEPRFGLTHESLSAHIIRTVLSETIRRIRRTPDGDRLAEDEAVDPEIVANIVQTGGEKVLDALWKTLSLIIRGPYDADKMDFVLRDGAACGLEGIDPHEVERLILTSFIAPGPSGSPLMLLDSSSLIPLLAFLRQRQYLLQAVYYHRTVRSLEAAIREPLIWASQSILKESPLKDLDSEYVKRERQLPPAPVANMPKEVLDRPVLMYDRRSQQSASTNTPCMQPCLKV